MSTAGDFNLHDLYDALDAQRVTRGMTWTEVAREVDRHRTTLRPRIAEW